MGRPLFVHTLICLHSLKSVIVATIWFPCIKLCLESSGRYLCFYPFVWQLINYSWNDKRFTHLAQLSTNNEHVEFIQLVDILPQFIFTCLIVPYNNMECFFGNFFDKKTISLEEELSKHNCWGYRVGYLTKSRPWNFCMCGTRYTFHIEPLSCVM